MKSTSKFLLVLLVAFSFNTKAVDAFGLDEVHAYGMDTIAGYSALLSTSATYPDRELFFNVKKPDGSVLTIPAVTNSEGIAKIDLYDYHTRKAGKYEVSANLKGNAPNGSWSYFTVHPDRVSAEKSEASVQRTVIKADDVDRGYIAVRIVDQYGNPFAGHFVRLISSRSDDRITAASKDAVTNVNGELTFAVSSKVPGVSIYSVVDATAGVVLAARIEMAFLEGANYLNDAGGHIEYFIPVASAQDAGPLNKFGISGIPELVEPNTNISFSVTAQDQSGLTVQNYAGTIHFSVEGPNSLNVTLPEDYSFKAEDLGIHEFSLGLKFTEAGSYKLVVTDVSNTAVKGELNVAVGSGSVVTTGGGAKPVISSPVEGTYSQNVQTISGTSQSLSTVKIFDNDQEIGMVQSDSSGRFSFQTTPLEDGSHELYAVLLDSSNAVAGTSDTVEFFIDTRAPVVDDLIIEPSSGIKAGDVITLTLISENNLSDAAVIFNLDIYQMLPGTGAEGTYVASFQAPELAGEYPIDVLLVDELGNEDTYQNVAMLSIGENGDGAVIEEDLPDVTDTTEVAGQPPSQVFGVIAYGSDKRVTLVWEAATDDGLINNYKIYYGTDALNLTNVVETKDAATTWYVGGLENGKEYFFAISAVDDMGVESLFTSELESAIPFTLEVQTAVTDRPFEALQTAEEEAYLRGAAIESRAPDRMVENGPGLIWLLAGTGFLSGFARKLSRKKK